VLKDILSNVWQALPAAVPARTSAAVGAVASAATTTKNNLPGSSAAATTCADSPPTSTEGEPARNTGGVLSRV